VTAGLVSNGTTWPRWPVVLVAVASAVIATSLVSRSQAGGFAPGSCTDISAVPVEYSITYGAAIQEIFSNYSGMSAGCVDCHVNPWASGNLSLEPGISWGNLVNVPSDEDFSLMYVVPNHPEQSLLFQKINCDVPTVGERMPLGGYAGGLSPQQQALIYDWIAAGAPAGTTDGIFRNAFEYRGYNQ
jgi:hypothetical protein